MVDEHETTPTATTPCATCHGTGYFEQEQGGCETCGGTGVIHNTSTAAPTTDTAPATPTPSELIAKLEKQIASNAYMRQYSAAPEIWTTVTLQEAHAAGLLEEILRLQGVVQQHEIEIGAERERADTQERQRQARLADPIVRVLRIYEFVGPRSVIEQQVARSVHGRREFGARNDCAITGVTLTQIPERLDEARSIDAASRGEILSREIADLATKRHALNDISRVASLLTQQAAEFGAHIPDCAWTGEKGDRWLHAQAATLQEAAATLAGGRSGEEADRG
jgi:hypothetical protein